jgi:predicted GNAT superfamily acetyltransferase
VSAEGEAVIIRDLATHDEYLACLALQDETWGTTFSERVPPAILRVSQRIGGVCAGAFDADGGLVGFVFGMTGVQDGRIVHWSDMLAVREGFRGRRLGEQLKYYQRDKVRTLGAELMMWTYDPLVARNAHLNINRLGAFPVEYVPDMYGSQTGSALHGGLPTDRLIVAWDLTDSSVAHPRSAAESDAAGRFVNPLGADGLPGALAADATGAFRIQVPRDFQSEQRSGTDRAPRWRFAVRESFVTLFQRGYRVTHFVVPRDDQLPYYVLTPPSVAGAR